MKWEFNENNKTDKENSEDEDSEEYPESDLNESSFNQFRAGSQTINPFLESEPIENLEQDLQNIPSQTHQQSHEEEPEYASITNAPQYSAAGYDSAGYDLQQTSKDPEMMRTNQIRNSDISSMTTLPSERAINMRSWNQQAGEGYPKAQNNQGENYIRTPGKSEQESWSPFKRKEPEKY